MVIASQAEGKKTSPFGWGHSFVLRVLHLLVWLFPGGDGERLIGRPGSDVWDVRRMGDLASLRIGNLNTGMIEQKAGSAIQFDLGFLIGRFGGDKRDFGRSHARLVLQHES